MITHTPLLAPIISLFWKQPHMELLISREHEKVTELFFTQVVFQGECLSTAFLCIFLRIVIHQFYAALESIEPPKDFTPPPRELVTILAYVDDVVLSCHPDLLFFVWPLWLKILADHGLQGETSECKAWIPQDTVKNSTIDTHSGCPWGPPGPRHCGSIRPQLPHHTSHL